MTKREIAHSFESFRYYSFYQPSSYVIVPQWPSLYPLYHGGKNVASLASWKGGSELLKAGMTRKLDEVARDASTDSLETWASQNMKDILPSRAGYFIVQQRSELAASMMGEGGNSCAATLGKPSGISFSFNVQRPECDVCQK
jgi:hypothetical protein